MERDIVELTQSNGIATLTLNNPDRRNALSTTMMTRLSERLDAISRDESTRCVILAARGTVFCSGHDLKEMKALREQGAGAYARVFGQCSALMTQIVRLPQPVIAQVEGVATAAGAQLVASCDLAVAGEDNARFATPGVNIGLFCSTPMVALSRKISPRKMMMEMLLTGVMIDGEEAMRIGLVNHSVSPDEVAELTAEMANIIASKSPTTIKIGKEAFYKQLELPMVEAYEYCSRVMTENMMDPDAEEGIEAFLGKRDPVWQADDGKKP